MQAQGTRLAENENGGTDRVGWGRRYFRFGGKSLSCGLQSMGALSSPCTRTKGVCLATTPDIRKSGGVIEAMNNENAKTRTLVFS